MMMQMKKKPGFLGGQSLPLISMVLCWLCWGGCAPDPKEEVVNTPFLKATNPAVDSLWQSLDERERLAQLFLLNTSAKPQDSISPAGIRIKAVSPEEYLEVKFKWEKQPSCPPLFFGEPGFFMRASLSGLSDLPPGPVGFSRENEPVFEYLKQEDRKWRRLFSLSAQKLLDLKAPPEIRAEALQSLPERLEDTILVGAGPFSDFYLSLPDTSPVFDWQLAPLRAWVEQGLGYLELDREQLLSDSLQEQGQGFVRKYVQEQLSFDGLLISTCTSPEEAVQLLETGVDLLEVEGSLSDWLDALEKVVDNRSLKRTIWQGTAYKNLQAKYWAQKLSPKREEQMLPTATRSEAEPVSGSAWVIHSVDSFLKDSGWDYLLWEWRRQLSVYLPASNTPLPLVDVAGRRFRIIEYGTPDTFDPFAQQFTRFSSIRRFEKWTPESDTLSGFNLEESGLTYLLLLDNLKPSPRKDSAFWRDLIKAGTENEIILVHFGQVSQLRPFDTTYTLLQLPDRSSQSQRLAAQIIVGAAVPSGRLPHGLNRFFSMGAGETFEKIRVGEPPLEGTGFQPESLASVQAIMRNAGRNGATPGGQVVVFQGGDLVLERNFGTHTYRNRDLVRSHHLYDLASITKVAATTLAVMGLYEQGRLDTKKKLAHYLPEFKQTALSGISLEELLTHQSGLPPNPPIYRYWLARDSLSRNCTQYFCEKREGPFQIKVADNFYFNEQYLDTLWRKVKETEVQKPKRYRYSDLNFLLLQRVVESQAGMPIEQYLEREFYGPMRLKQLKFHPLNYFPKSSIVPTELDLTWRRQLVWGYVHDPAAALLGGAAGNAGLFGNAYDLAILGQMLVNEGTYGGRRYLKPATVRKFTETAAGTNRGLGFDKPRSGNDSGRAWSLSPSAFGHTGFTGTAFWVDPEQEMVFVILTNRVHPDPENRKLFTANVRRRVHQAVYDARVEAGPTFPELPGR